MFKSIFSRGLGRGWFSQKVSIFKKTTILTPLDLPYTKSIDRFQNQDLSFEEILEFDLYYQEFYFRASKRLESNSKKFNESLKENIFGVLEKKMGKNTDKIAFFLENRIENLTEIEILYCFETIMKLNKVSEFKLVHTKLYLRILDAVKDFKFSDTTTIRNFLEICKVFEVEDQDIFIKIVENFLVLTKKMFEKTMQNDEIYQIIDSFIILIQLTKMDTAQITEKILRILNFIMKNHKTVDFAKLRELIMALNRNNVVINLNYLSDFDAIFTEHRPKISNSEAIDILYIFAKNKYLKPNFATFFTEIKDFQNFLVSLKGLELSTFIWSISQLDRSISFKRQFEVIEENLLEIFEKNIGKFEKKDVRTIVQSFNHAGEGSRKFWGFFNEMPKFAKLGMSLNELFVILVNQMKFKYFERNLLNFFYAQFDTPEKFEFLSQLGNPQILNIFQVTVLGIHDFHHSSEETNNDQKFNHYIMVLADMTDEVCEILFSEKALYKNMEINEMIKLFKLFDLTHMLLTKNQIEIEEELTNALDALVKRIQRKIDLIPPQDYAKTIVFLENMLNADEDFSLKLLVRMESKISEVLKENREWILDLIPFFWKYQMKRSKLWGLLQVWLIQVLDVLKANDIVLAASVFNQLETEKIIEKNQGFWDFLLIIFTESEFQPELGRILMQKVDKEAFNNALEAKAEKLGVSIENFNEVLSKTGKPHEKMLEEIKSECSKGDITQTEWMMDLF